MVRVVNELINRMNRKLNPLEIELIRKWVEVNRYSESFILDVAPKKDIIFSSLDSELKKRATRKVVYNVGAAEALRSFFESLKA